MRNWPFQSSTKCSPTHNQKMLPKKEKASRIPSKRPEITFSSVGLMLTILPQKILRIKLFYKTKLKEFWKLLQHKLSKKSRMKYEILLKLGYFTFDDIFPLLWNWNLIYLFYYTYLPKNYSSWILDKYLGIWKRIDQEGSRYFRVINNNKFRKKYKQP